MNCGEGLEMVSESKNEKVDSAGNPAFWMPFSKKGADIKKSTLFRFPYSPYPSPSSEEIWHESGPEGVIRSPAAPAEATGVTLSGATGEKLWKFCGSSQLACRLVHFFGSMLVL